MTDLSAVITTLNEEEHITKCVQALQKVTDDIIIVDAFSKDRTKEICEQLPVRFEQREWEGYSKAKNYGNSLARHNLILSLDADEYLDETLIGSINRIKDPQAAYCLKLNTFFCGKWIKHGPFHIRSKVRIFNRQSAHWQESDLVHEGLVFKDKKAKKIRLKGYLLHHAFPTLEYFLFKMNKYSSLHAEEMIKNHPNTGLLSAFFSGLHRFTKEYFFKLGFLDGRYGLVLACYGFFYNFTKNVKTFVR